jgi:chorismate synthase
MGKKLITVAFDLEGLDDVVAAIIDEDSEAFGRELDAVVTFGGLGGGIAEAVDGAVFSGIGDLVFALVDKALAARLDQ